MRAGAYTTARTVNRTNVFDLSFHINRLAETATLMTQQAAAPAPPEIQDAGMLRPLVLQTLQSAISSVPEEEEGQLGELKLTLLAHWEDGVPAVEAHVEPMPPRPVAPVKVQVCLRQSHHMSFSCTIGGVQ